MKEFHLHIDKTGSNWIYSLRLREREGTVGSQIATFNPHACLHRDGLMEKIVDTLNKELRAEEQK